ncbi:MAG: DMT family transporter [Paracoccaceae bacterium]
MLTLGLGLIAAFCWGLHDICVRWVSQRTPLMAALLTVLIAGSLFQGIYMAAEGSFAPIPGPALGLAFLSGVAFTVASVGLYHAFAVGPVRLVSPIIAAYPVLSVSWAALSGSPVTLLQWLAIGAIITGVSTVAVLSHPEETATATSRTPTILWALLAACGFAVTFALGQAAARIAPDLPVILMTRLAAITALVVVMAATRIPFVPTRQALPILATMGLLDAIALVCVLSAGGLPNAEYAAVTSSVFGMVTILLAWAFLNEHMARSQWAGVLLAFSGIAYLAA